MGFRIHAGVAVALFLLVLVVLFASLAKRLRVPYPILLVVAGLLISFIPHVPRVPLEPDLVFLVFLPPLLYAAAWQTDFREFRRSILPIASLAFGLVAFTVLGVALFADHFITALDFKSGFVLGAVVAATDAIAAASIASSIGLPRRVMTLLEGESLLNDASSLLALEFGLSLLERGDAPTLLGGGGRFLWLLAGGILVGLAIGFLAHLMERFLHDGPTEIVFSLVMPYAAYLAGEEVRASGVIAVVACGLYLSRYRSSIFTASSRLDILSAWRALNFLLNGLVFVLIGLQLPYVLTGIRGYSLGTLLLYGAVFSLILIALRLLWVYPSAYTSRLLRHLFRREHDQVLSARETFVVGWTGMRGVVALAAAISLPETLAGGRPFLQRNLLIFLTFSIILVTLVLQGLTLPTLVRGLGLVGESDSERLAQAKKTLLGEAVSFLRQREQETGSEDEKHLARDLIHRYRHLMHESGPDALSPFVRLTGEVLAVERNTLARLEQSGELDADLARRLEHQLDLTETRFTES